MAMTDDISNTPPPSGKESVEGLAQQYINKWWLNYANTGAIRLGFKAGYTAAKAATPDSREEGKGEELQLWNGIDGELEDVDSLEDARKWLRENFSEPGEGIHPDIELCYVVKKVASVVLEPVETGRINR